MAPARFLLRAFLSGWLLAGLGSASFAAASVHQQRAFEAAQWALISSAGKALQQLGLRAAAGSGELAGLVRQRQDLVAMISERERAIGDLPDEDAAARAAKLVALRGEIDSLQTEVAGIDRRLATDFPRYAELSNPKPLSIADVQALLDEEEALLVFLTGASNNFVWAIGKHDSAWHSSFYGKGLLAEDVALLRAQLDPNSAANRGAKSLQETGGPKVAPFDRLRAFVLYGELIKPVEKVLAGKTHVFVVADGPLAALPLSVLVSAKPEGEDTDPAALRKTAWLAKRYAFTTLPSVGSLSIIRTAKPAKTSDAGKRFAGFGAPILGGQRAPLEVASADNDSFFRGSLADVEAVRDLAPLPQTGPELLRLAKAMGASPETVYLDARATETAVKRADLSKVDILAFATHGLLSGDLKGLAEPALVLTPPEVATQTDDGLLTASEVAELDLSAEWVILSACNTAGGDGRPDADGLSGLARAFIYAGARAILVSHWPVRDDAAAKLTTGAIGLLTGNHGLRRSEALGIAMLDVMQDTSDPTLAHPSAWAPFVVVGEGGY